MEGKAVWRWNVDDVWLTFSSAFQEMTLASEATNDIARYHHLSASLLFCGCTLESFLNRQMRIFLEDGGAGESDIYKKLRNTSVGNKLKKWPREIGRQDLPPADVDKIVKAIDLRNDITHRKARDHSLYADLDGADPSEFVCAVQHVIATSLAAVGDPFPYWLLGWNYVGMNFDESHPCLLNNQQFRYSLNHMGFRVPAASYGAAIAWERENMVGVESLSRMRAHVYASAPEIEPRRTNFGPVPRLSKRWWDKSLT